MVVTKCLSRERTCSWRAERKRWLLSNPIPAGGQLMWSASHQRDQLPL